MNSINKLLPIVIGIIFFQISHAQEMKISGTITSDDNGETLSAVSIKIKGKNFGTSSDFDGEYSIDANRGDVLEFSFIGMKTKYVKVEGSNRIDVIMNSDTQLLDDVVVTALGIKKEKKSLGYSVQKVSGDDVNVVKSGNITNSLSGKIAGVKINRTNNMGGSTNVIIRGNSSLSGDNQALFVVDGVPISNYSKNANTTKHTAIDYGNIASDINPEDIKSVEVLKGAAASVLYGSQAANGVIMITTKKGGDIGTKSANVIFKSSTSFGFLDQSTFPEYQKEYGGGSNGEDSWVDFPIGLNTVEKNAGVPFNTQASFGPKYSDKKKVYNWWAAYSESGKDKYRKKGVWKYAENDPLTYFETPVTLSNTISVSGSNESASYRLSYTNHNEKGSEPNGSINKDNFSLSSSYKFSNKLSSNVSVSNILQKAIGRSRMGRDDNNMTMFRQLWATNVDLKQQREAYEKNKKNISWNFILNGDKPHPSYWNNIYFERYENYPTDYRNRWLGNASLDYKFIDLKGLKVSGLVRASIDTYYMYYDMRIQKGSRSMQLAVINDLVTSGYYRADSHFKLFNHDAILNIDADINPDLSFVGLIGTTVKREHTSFTRAHTNGGLGIAGHYFLRNSMKSILPPKEYDTILGTNSLYSSASLDYKKYAYVDLSVRADQSSTLPQGSNLYVYPSMSTSVILTELIDIPHVSFGKLRVNVAQVGASAEFDKIVDTYMFEAENGGAVSGVHHTKKNPELKPESTTSYEVGLDLKLLDNKIGLDMAFYYNLTKDQISNVTTTSSTGYTSKMVNGGKLSNKGLEIALSSKDISLGLVSWNSSVNWSMNRSEVLSLAKGVKKEKLHKRKIGTNVSIHSTKGSPYGLIYGTDFEYHKSGAKIVDKTTGKYKVSESSSKVIGNQNPDWLLGFSNSFSYEGFVFSFLIDCQKGGDIFSVDMLYGLGNGLYKETSFTNENGKNIRDKVADGGGILNPGVYEDGTKNTTRMEVTQGSLGGSLPDKAFVYDASYIKLREMSISYDLPLGTEYFKKITLGLVGSNLWILYKNLPYADPEASMGAGNAQGFSVGSLPTFRELAVNIKLNF
ncbi:SusC/RagA family TonB-linked outer membrane protein [Ichthyobacterium seriolicida]|uniref:TonB-dependent receptor n=1 Tax=Ichthyobacterium seriolicida TaxID=242600 RepID=A0A1J1E083_9FLAO|nr:SusC/RagA family TonB-linked outer membrane protein [Ichthyobacterium seriolicida]BAV94341.1 TonB-dependent receptor [Ichthyobacterium seriolicida]